MLGIKHQPNVHIRNLILALLAQRPPRRAARARCALLRPPRPPGILYPAPIRVVPNPNPDKAAAGQHPGVQTNADGDTVHLSSSSQELTKEEHQQVEKLKSRDAEVRTHEQAHLAAAGGHAQGGIKLEYQTGPDGQRYAVGGSVGIDTSPASTPEQTIQKAQQIRRAALAPADPSGADRAVAAKASRMEAEAQREITEARDEQRDFAINPASGAPKTKVHAMSPRLDLVA